MSVIDTITCSHLDAPIDDAIIAIVAASGSLPHLEVVHFPFLTIQFIPAVATLNFMQANIRQHTLSQYLQNNGSIDQNHWPMFSQELLALIPCKYTSV